MLLFACSQHSSTSPQQTGAMPIAMNLQPALEMGLRVTQVHVTITHGDYSASMDLNIVENTASGTFDELEPGVYAIDVDVYEDTTLIATGQGAGEVLPGQTTTVNISLQFVTGELEVVVEWEEEAPPQHILMVGNSHTYYNTGIYTHVQQLVDIAHPEWEISIAGQTVGGYTLEQHYNNAATIAAIQEGDWDMVILQETSTRGAYEPELFHEYAILFDELISQTGAETGFFMVQPWEDDEEMYGLTVANATYIGAFLDATVAPVGIAYVNALQLQPELNLYNADGYHPSMAGTYLGACVFYSTLWGESTEGIPWWPMEISEEDAELLQQVAWQTVQAYPLAD